MNIYDIMLGQAAMLAEKERFMRYYRRAGIEEARRDYHLEIDIPDEYHWTKKEEEAEYTPQVPAPRPFRGLDLEEREFGARDILRAAGIEEGEILDYMVSKYGDTKKGARDLLDYDGDFKERIGKVM